MLLRFFCFSGRVNLKPLAPAPLIVGCAAILIVLGLRLLPFDFIDRQERVTYDLRVWAAARAAVATATNLGFVYIDENTITGVRRGFFGYRHGLYWPRHVYARIVDELRLQGAQLVGFDVLFPELRSDLHAQVELADGQRIESDDYFALQMRAASNVVIAATPDLEPHILFATNALAIGDIETEADLDGILRRAKPFLLYTNWHWAFRRLELPEYDMNLKKAKVAASGITVSSPADSVTIPLNTNGEFDITGLWQIPPNEPTHARPFAVQRFWHMGIVLAAHAMQLDLERAEITPRQVTLRGPGGLVRKIPLDREGNFLIDWCLPLGHPALTQVAAHHLLAQEAKRNRGESEGLESPCRGKIMIVGSSALANDLTDRGATPLSKSTVLVSKHWNVANSVILGRFVRRLDLGGELACIALVGILAAFSTWRLRPVASVPLVVAIVAAYTAISFLVYFRTRLWIPLVLPWVSAFLAHAMVLAYRVIFEEAEQRKVRSLFAKMVSPKIVSELLSAEKLSLGGAKREVTVFFADVRGFTELTVRGQQEASDTIQRKGLTGSSAEACYDQKARETLETVNLYLGQVADTVLRHDGTFDKFIGDCVMAFWGAPTPNPHHALACVRAAIAAQNAIAMLNDSRRQENARREAENIRLTAAGLEPMPLLSVLTLGTGINTGSALAGLMGSAAERAEALSYTVFGREVNLASRLEGAAGYGRIFISEATLQHLRREAPELADTCIPRDPVQLKGFSTPVPVYEVPWSHESSS